MLEEIIGQNLRRIKEIRFHKIKTITKNGYIKYIEHPCYVFLENDDCYIYVTLTHSDKVEDFLVIKLRKNPNPKDERDSYYVADVRIDSKAEFARMLKGWKLDPLDDEDIRKLLDDLTEKDN